LAADRPKVNADFTSRRAPDYSLAARFAVGAWALMEAVAAPPLEDLRAEIDRIDQALLDLLIERTEVVRRIGEIKGDRRDGRPAMRPAREAQILRRLVAHAGDRFPRRALVRMWRELLASLTRLQAPHSVAVYLPEGQLGTWDLARDHFGSVTPMSRVDGASQALRAVSDRSATVAVLPLPHDEDVWWLALMSDQHDRLRVFARLPFVASVGGDGEEARALALGRLELEPSDDDLSLLAIEAEPDVSRGRLRDLLAAAGLAPFWLAAGRPPAPPQAFHLVEVGGFVRDGDERLGAVVGAAREEVLRIVPVGSYPRPLPAE
jgi:chorismate mutase/prephenate dehydratase